MNRIFISAIVMASVPACANMPDWAIGHHVPDSGAVASHGQYSFDWQLSGERQLAPIQVFDDGQQTWLQFQPEQVVPAVFQRTRHGDRLLSHTRQGDYLILDGVWPELAFRGGSLQASARKLAHHGISPDNGIQPVQDVMAGDGTDEADVIAAHAAPVPTAPTITEAPDAAQLPSATEAPVVQLSSAEAPDVTDASPVAETLIVPGTSVAAGVSATMAAGNVPDRPSHSADAHYYGVTIQDGSFREALHRWAVGAGWVFEPEHWAVDVDIPVSAEAAFNGTFQEAVQGLMSATELADRPLRPCFYSNQVLRVVPYAQSCDRSSGARKS